jgi:hypothetical protein
VGVRRRELQEIKGFLGWLEGLRGGAKVEDLTPKTKLQSYYEHDYEGMMAVLKKNSKKLAIKSALRKPGEDINAEFEESMSKLLPLRYRIRKTDELIAKKLCNFNKSIARYDDLKTYLRSLGME